MKLLTFTLSLLFFTSSYTNINAQWDASNEGIVPTDYRVWSIKVAPDESVWMIATLDAFPPSGETPKVFRSVDNGENFMRSEIAGGLGEVGWDIAPVNKDLAFASVREVGLFKTIDGGGNWERIESFIHRPFYVHFFNELEGWVLAVAPAGFLVMSTTDDGGETWTFNDSADNPPPGTSFPAPVANESVISIGYAFSSSYDYNDDSIIVGTSTGNYWLSSDKGKNWVRGFTPLEEMGLSSTNLAMKDESTFMIVSDLEQQTFNGTATVSYATRDGGKTWIEGAPGVTASTVQYLPQSDSIFIAAGHNNFGWASEGTAISYDYGANWNIIDGNSIIAMDFLTMDIGYGVCCNNFWPTANGQVHKWNANFLVSNNDIVKNDRVTIQPNPASSFLLVSLNDEFKSEKLSVDILSLNGQLLSAFELTTDDQIEIPLIDMVSGFYTLRITGDERTVIKKFVKE